MKNIKIDTLLKRKNIPVRLREAIIGALLSHGKLREVELNSLCNKCNRCGLQCMSKTKVFVLTKSKENKDKE